LAGFGGTAEAVPFPKTIYETSCKTDSLMPKIHSS